MQRNRFIVQCKAGEPLSDDATAVKKLPVLDASESWAFDASADAWATEPVQTVIGYWRTVKFSGALPAQRLNELVDRVEKLQQAVKLAREEANNIEAQKPRVGESIFRYLFG